MISRQALGPFYTPHDDVPRWPTDQWLSGLRRGLMVADRIADFDRICAYLNNLALLAVHARSSVLAERTCHLQIEYICRVSNALPPRQPARALCQPALNLMRLQIRMGGDWNRGPRAWLSATNEGPILGYPANLPIWPKFHETKYDPNLSAIADSIFARELAALVARGRLTSEEMTDAFELQRIGSDRVPLLARSVMAEARMISTDRIGDAIDDLHPYLVGLYALLLDAPIPGDGYLEAYLRLLLGVRPCGRAMAEIALETVVQISRRNLFSTSAWIEPMLTYILDVGDEVLLHHFQDKLSEAASSTTWGASVYFHSATTNELRSALAQGVADTADFFASKYLSASPTLSAAG